MPTNLSNDKLQDIANNLMYYLLQLGYVTQTSIADKLKISSSNLSGYLTGKKQFTQKLALRFRKCFNVNPAYLLSGRGPIIYSGEQIVNIDENRSIQSASGKTVLVVICDKRSRTGEAGGASVVGTYDCLGDVERGMDGLLESLFGKQEFSEKHLTFPWRQLNSVLWENRDPRKAFAFWSYENGDTITSLLIQAINIKI